MTRQTVRMLAALAVAIGLALPFMVPAIGGIATWKIVLGVLGGALFIIGSRRETA